MYTSRTERRLVTTPGVSCIYIRNFWETGKIYGVYCTMQVYCRHWARQYIHIQYIYPLGGPAQRHRCLQQASWWIWGLISPAEISRGKKISFIRLVQGKAHNYLCSCAAESRRPVISYLVRRRNWCGEQNIDVWCDTWLAVADLWLRLPEPDSGNEALLHFRRGSAWLDMVSGTTSPTQRCYLIRRTGHLKGRPRGSRAV